LLFVVEVHPVEGTTGPESQLRRQAKTLIIAAIEHGNQGRW
jgi:hypothetical protein